MSSSAPVELHVSSPGRGSGCEWALAGRLVYERVVLGMGGGK